MNVVNFNERACEKYRAYFNAYLDNSLLVETNQDVLRHLSSCSECARILEDRARIKQMLRNAVRKQEAPPELLAAVQSRLHAERRSFFGFDAARLAMAAAAVFLFAILGVGTLRWGRVGPFGFDPSTFETVSAGVRRIMQLGLVDHVHCTILFQQWKRFITFDEMKANTRRSALGPEFIDMVPAVQAKLGNRYKIVNGHRCSAGGRRYIHLIMTADSNKTLVSLVITEKQDESFTAEKAVAIAKAGDISIYADRQGVLEVAGFESGKYLAYIVSNTERNTNLRIASDVAPVVMKHLRALEL
jgi:hypothetical protein